MKTTNTVPRESGAIHYCHRSSHRHNHQSGLRNSDRGSQKGQSEVAPQARPPSQPDTRDGLGCTRGVTNIATRAAQAQPAIGAATAASGKKDTQRDCRGLRHLCRDRSSPQSSEIAAIAEEAGTPIIGVALGGSRGMPPQQRYERLVPGNTSCFLFIFRVFVSFLVMRYSIWSGLDPHVQHHGHVHLPYWPSVFAYNGKQSANAPGAHTGAWRLP